MPAAAVPALSAPEAMIDLGTVPGRVFDSAAGRTCIELADPRVERFPRPVPHPFRIPAGQARATSSGN